MRADPSASVVQRLVQSFAAIAPEGVVSELVSRYLASDYSERAAAIARSKITQRLCDAFEKFRMGEPAAVRAVVQSTLATADSRELVQFLARTREEKVDWGYRAPDPLVRRLCKTAIPLILDPQSELVGLENLSELKDQRVILMGNHLSAIDVHALVALAAKNGDDSLDRLTCVVGYKTFELTFLRQMSLCFGTLKVPQSLKVSASGPELTAREMATLSRGVIESAHQRLACGDALMVFPEGTRSRNGGAMHRLLPAITKYIRGSNAFIIPIGFDGTDLVLSVDSLQMNRAKVTIRIGTAVHSTRLEAMFRSETRNQDTMDFIGEEIARLLPAERRGPYNQFSAAA